MTWICSIIIAGKGKCCTPDKTSMQDKPVDLFSVGMMLACPQNERVILWYTPLTQGVCVCTASFCSLLSCSFLFFFLSSRHAISQFRLSLSERIQSFFCLFFLLFLTASFSSSRLWYPSLAPCQSDRCCRQRIHCWVLWQAGRASAKPSSYK